ncbi:MAG: ACT domain-containing protein [Bacteroidales bacterium]|nr:ACT domain-containing protein [Bacteroidales bacterium]
MIKKALRAVPRFELKLKLLEGNFTIHRFEPGAEIPAEVYSSEFFNISKTDEELSIVCPGLLVLNSEHYDKDWACIKVLPPLDLSLTGILAELSGVLAEAQISIFAISTYDTDYIMVKANKVNEAITSLKAAGYKFM